MSRTKLDIFKEKAKEIAEHLGIDVKSCEEIKEHKIENYVVEKHYLVNKDKVIIVYTNDLC
jgi:hypothetical protein